MGDEIAEKDINYSPWPCNAGKALVGFDSMQLVLTSR